MAEGGSNEEQELDCDTSLSDDSDVIDAFEMVLDEGEAELVLVSRKVSISWYLSSTNVNYMLVALLRSPRACEASHTHEPTQEVLGGQGYVEFFRKCTSSLKEEKIIQRSPKGQRVRGLLDYLESGMPEDDVAEIATMLIPQVNKCIIIGGNASFPLLRKLQRGHHFTSYAKRNK